MEIGVITNPNSRKNRNRPDRADRLRRIVGDFGEVERGRSRWTGAGTGDEERCKSDGEDGADEPRWTRFLQDMARGEHRELVFSLAFFIAGIFCRTR